MTDIKEQDSRSRAGIIAGLLDSKKAEDIKILDVRKKTELWDYFVVCSGLSGVHVKTLYDTVHQDMAKLGQPAAHRDTGNDNKWIILDFGDILVHIFEKEIRQHYAIETMWGEKEASSGDFLKKAEKAVRSAKAKKAVKPKRTANAKRAVKVKKTAPVKKKGKKNDKKKKK